MLDLLSPGLRMPIMNRRGERDHGIRPELVAYPKTPVDLGLSGHNALLINRSQMKAHALRKLVALVAVVVAVGCGAFVLMKAAPGKLKGQIRPSSYAELVALPETDLAAVDVAVMNLLCAEGLPGAEGLDLKASLAVLDQWTEVARQAERKYLPQFQRNPARYDHSLAKFKAVNLGLTLKQDLGCDYNKEISSSGVMADIRSTRFFRNSRDLFLHGFIENRKGSCSSLPVLMVAIGRRCGYPLFLVPSKGHLFCRWDDGKERFNLEIATQGVDSQPDSYYRGWPYPFNEEELASEKYLKSLTPAEELGLFAEIRGDCLRENQRRKESAQAYEVALRSFPKSKMVKANMINVKGEN